MTSESLTLAFIGRGALVVDFAIKGWARLMFAGNLPMPLNSHMRSISGNA